LRWITLTQGSHNLEVNDVVESNTITYSGSAKLRNPTGGMNPSLPYTIFEPADDNYFDYNTYHFSVPTLLLSDWVYNTAGMSWSAWQAAGEDIHGTAD
jgi:hypothetical protein